MGEAAFAGVRLAFAYLGAAVLAVAGAGERLRAWVGWED